ncbi:hypothetical protein N0392_12340 [Morganella morganii]|uniref:Tail fiber protein n=1 Tax=Morganella morganii TaxID=582 RepID=A0A9Q4CRW0_MORMO|nr:hypothetical protein [Morganella morganii]MCY0790471.1 hypothetical protein [Morganella morganii]
MKKIGDVTSTADKNGEWTNGNVAAGIAPTILEAGWLNSVQREILGVIIAAGMQQDKNDDTQLSKAISKIISGGNYATAEDLKKYLAKDQNGADIPNKDTFIKNLGLPELFADGKRFHTSPESVEMITPNGSIIIELTNNGYVNIINKSTGLLAEIPPTGLEQQSGVHPKRMMSQKGVTDLAKSVETPVGMFATFPHRATQLPPKWYSTNGDRFSVSSPQGLALKSLPAELKSDWGITESGGMINVPNIKQSDGRTPFLRPVNGTERQVGSVDGDKMRRMQGEYANSSWRDPGGGWGGASGVFGVRYATGTSGTAGSNQGTTLVFDSEKVVPTGAEFKPLDIGVTLAIYLGV